jgi:hypothetical protein
MKYIKILYINIYLSFFYLFFFYYIKNLLNKIIINTYLLKGKKNILIGKKKNNLK